ncbi:hypothetical protein BDV27DRAFT_154108 [Aspergillus caelatus]|uniref:Mid2 domain-containing protein n=1 Tax=Aspergillus caelatus TaxID=61420 RepID=A0A5N7AEV6_9EURO|nr:uncharacterized protein BDV27DRAFT_154108 [Aspergillus caelatus]KAE8368401.1 hypothetical protein BDV27DRAFT_154108 [Aspergillus caelatus]
MVNCTWPEGIIADIDLVPCGTLNGTHPVLPCCARGDTCLTDNICGYSHSTQGGSGYYTAACTANSTSFDDTENKSVCVNRRGDTSIFPILSTTQVTISGNAVVEHSKNEIANLHHQKTASTLPLKMISSHTGSSSGSTTVTAESHLSDDGSSSLSTGAKAGIGIGAAVGGILLITGAFFLIRRRRQKHQVMPVTEGPLLSQSPFASPPPQELSATHKRLSAQELE